MLLLSLGVIHSEHTLFPWPPMCVSAANFLFLLFVVMDDIEINDLD